MREELLQQYGLFLIGAGLSLALVLLLFLILRRNALKKRGLRPTAAAVMAEQDDQEADMPETAAARVNQGDEADTSADEAGFKLFKRKKTANTADTLSDGGPDGGPKGGADDLNRRLIDIEQEMLAIRELFRTGQISRTVYVAESKALYETARLVKD